MKVTMMSVMCGPEGNAFQGQVIDVPDKKMISYEEGEGDNRKAVQKPLGEYMIDKKFARPFDENLDRKARRGLIKAEK